MYKLSADDIQSMLRDAARVLTKDHDREVVQRLYESMKVTEPDAWDKVLLATLLCKAGKLHEAEIVALDIDVAWKRAEALLNMSRAIAESVDAAQAPGLLHAAALQATSGLNSESPHDKLDSSSVLGEIAVQYAQEKDYATARQLAEQITDPTRQTRTLEKIDEFDPPPAAEDAES